MTGIAPKLYQLDEWVRFITREDPKLWITALAGITNDADNLYQQAAGIRDAIEAIDPVLKRMLLYHFDQLPTSWNGVLHLKASLIHTATEVGLAYDNADPTTAQPNANAEPYQPESAPYVEESYQLQTEREESYQPEADSA